MKKLYKVIILLFTFIYKITTKHIISNNIFNKSWHIQEENRLLHFNDSSIFRNSSRDILQFKDERNSYASILAHMQTNWEIQNIGNL